MKLVSLTVARNEDWIVGLSLRVALRWVDHAVVLCHACEDLTRSIVGDIYKEHPGRVTILDEPERVWMEMPHRQRTLDNGRLLGGTHFAIVDCDEIPTANIVPRMREWTEKLGPGQLLDLPLIPVWGGLDYYRTDPLGDWKRGWVTTAFRDIHGATWKPKEDGYQYHNRPPLGTKVDPANRVMPVGKHAEGGIMHLQFAHRRRLRAKHALYKMDEVIRWPGREPNVLIDQKYSKQLKDDKVVLSPIPMSWWESYDRSLINLEGDPWQEKEVKRLWAQYGSARFKGLDLFGFAP